MSRGALEELYAAPPEEFVRERARLARSLRDAGRSEEADDVAGRRKPSLPVFAANALSRARTRDVAELLEAAQELRNAHGKGAPDALRDAQARLAHAVRSLVAEAAGAIGRPLSEEHEQRLATTLRESALDPEASGLLERGILSAEAEASGFELLAGVSLPEVPPRPRRGARTRETEPRAERGAAKLRALEQELSEAKRLLREAERAYAGAERALLRAREHVERLEGRVARAREV